MPKIIIYQLLPRLFGNRNTTNVVNGSIEENGCGKFNDITPEALESIKLLGITHIWYTGVIEHATRTDYSSFGIKTDPAHIVKGNAGSPYAIKDYYDICPDLAVDVPSRIDEFKSLLQRTHEAGMKVLIDLVPNHVARHYVSDARPDGVTDFGVDDDRSQAFSTQNNFYYLLNQDLKSPVPPTEGQWKWTENPARVTGNDCLSAEPSMNDWYETVKLNYGVDLFNGRSLHFDPVPDTWHKMLHIMQYWAKMGIDGFRCDMVEMVPVAFWHWAIAAIKKDFPDFLFVAEVYNPSLYQEYINIGGFDLLYDKVGMYDTLKDVVWGHRQVTDISRAVDTIAPFMNHMLFFTENHDEQRIASPFFADDPHKGWPATFVSTALLPNAMMLYFGQELGEKGMDHEGFSGLDGRTTIFDYWGIPSLQRWSNHGSFEGEQLTADEQLVRYKHSKLMQMVQLYEALSSGRTYDLTWCNSSFRVCSWVRYCNGQAFLLIASFIDTKVNIKLTVHSDMFEVCGLSLRGYYNADDIMDSGTIISFFSEVAILKGIDITIAPYGCMAFKLK